MSNILSYIIIGIGLSIDAFFICLALGCDKTENKKAVFLTPFIIAFFHIAFPLIFYFLTSYILERPEAAKIDAFSSYLAGGIFIILGFMNLFKKQETTKTFIVSCLSILFLSFSVSIDSILIGISLGFSKTSNIYLASIIFGLIAGFTAFYSIKLSRCTFSNVRKAHLYSGFLFIILGILSVLQII